MTVSWIPMFITGLIVFSLCFLTAQYIVDQLMPVWNGLDTDVPHSSNANWAMSFLIALIGATPVSCIITYVISGWMNAVQTQSGEVY
jgi:hypothetical protein